MSFRLTDAPLASAVELRVLQVTVVTRVMRVVLVVGVVVLVVLALLNNIVSRTSIKHKSTMLIVSPEKNWNKKN